MAVPVFPSAFLAGPGLFGPRRRNRPIGKGKGKVKLGEERGQAGCRLKNLARSIGGAILIAAIGLSWPSGANAFLITPKAATSGGAPGGLTVYDVSGLVPGDSFALSWGDGVDGLSLPGVNATGMVTLDALSSVSAQISVSINNLSPDTGGGDPRVTVFGLSILGYTSIDETDVNSSTGAILDKFDDALTPPGFSGFGDVVACVTVASCTNGAGGGILAAGGSDAFTLVVSGIFGSSLTLDSFAIKIQGGPPGGDDSYQLPGLPSAVPVPAALPLFLSALAGLSLIGWRRNRAAV